MAEKLTKKQAKEILETELEDVKKFDRCDTVVKLVENAKERIDSL